MKPANRNEHRSVTILKGYDRSPLLGSSATSLTLICLDCLLSYTGAHTVTTPYIKDCIIRQSISQLCKEKRIIHNNIHNPQNMQIAKKIYISLRINAKNVTDSSLVLLCWTNRSLMVPVPDVQL